MTEMETEKPTHAKIMATMSTTLRSLLADEMVLLVKAKHCHWKVRRSQLNELHSLFNSKYADIATMVEVMAERIKSLGYLTGKMKESIRYIVAELPASEINQNKSRLLSILSDFESIINSYIMQLKNMDLESK
jgi:starvation-inducible DNA-binding protein